MVTQETYVWNDNILLVIKTLNKAKKHRVEWLHRPQKNTNNMQQFYTYKHILAQLIDDRFSADKSNAVQQFVATGLRAFCLRPKSVEN